MKTKTNHKPEKIHTYDIKPNGKNATGAPTKYKPEYCQSIVKYFNDAPVWQEIQDSSTSDIKGGNKHTKKIPARMPTFDRWAFDNGLTHQTLLNWIDESKDFFEAYNYCKMLQKEWLIEVGMSGECPPAFAIFAMKNVTDWKDKTETDLNIKTFEEMAKAKKEYGI